MSGIHVVASAEVAAVLARGRGTQFLGPYFGHANSIAQAARDLDQPLAKLHYWTHRWNELGLLRVARTVHRKGRPIRHYRTIADEFEVPSALLPGALLEVQLARANRELLAALEGTVPEVALGGVLRIHKPAGHRHVSIERSVPAGTPVPRDDVLQVHFTAALTPEEAKQLHEELAQLHDRGSTDPTAAAMEPISSCSPSAHFHLADHPPERLKQPEAARFRKVSLSGPHRDNEPTRRGSRGKLVSLDTCSSRCSLLVPQTGTTSTRCPTPARSSGLRV